ncbi:unnamed protein product [Taenia asiatica]|uniref:RRM domain-containing protein n=1 Tax=Taenia asiatica TaxID=60517 RepID=A0A0R3WB11_TAEAS|nr:unnamed protein product [Taenia asiatica]
MVNLRLGILHFKASTAAQPSGMHHLVAAAVSTPSSSEGHISSHPSLENAQGNMRVPVHSENRTSVCSMKAFGSGVGASNLILDGPTLNHDCSEAVKELAQINIYSFISYIIQVEITEFHTFILAADDIQKDLEVEYEARLSSLAKIPTSRLGKANATTPDGDGLPSVFPPAFTVVLGGIPPNLAHRLFTSTNSSRIFSQSSGSLPVTPSAAAIIAAPPNPDCTGSLFFTSSNLTGENDAHCVDNARTSMVQPLTTNPHLVTVVAGEAALAEVDESSAAVAELTSEEATVSVGQNEAFEEDIDESIQISTS